MKGGAYWWMERRDWKRLECSGLASDCDGKMDRDGARSLFFFSFLHSLNPHGWQRGRGKPSRVNKILGGIGRPFSESPFHRQEGAGIEKQAERGTCI